MKKFFAILIVIGTLVISIAQADVIYVAGNVSGVWSADTVIVTAEVRVPPGDTLTIQPGVEVLFWDYFRFIVDSGATLLAVGNENDSIRFDEYSIPGGRHWGGIRFLNASSNSRLEFCHIIHGWASGGGDDNHGGAIYCNNSNIAIQNNLIDNCTAVDRGGGIYCNSSSPNISFNSVSSNNAGHGGGIYCAINSNPTISGNTINNNNSSVNGLGGGILCGGNSNPIINNNTISGNSTGQGGGIYCGASSPSIISNIISGNFTLWSAGGGILCTNNSHPIIKGNIISGNSVPEDGGGIYFESAPDTFELNEISGNTASWSGGGIYIVGISPALNKNTIVYNTAAGPGGGLYCSNSSPSLVNCILWGNSPQQIAQGAGSNPQVTYSDIQQVWPGTGNIYTDPLFYATTGDSAYHLSASSPCIDAGDPNPIYIDPDSTRADMGAYYFDHSGVQPNQLSGPLSGLLPAGEYHVVGDIFVQNGDSLTIEPGAVLRFDGNYSFDINGYLYAVGTEQDSIKFIRSDGVDSWEGIYINDSASDSCRIEFSLVNGCNSSALNLNNCNPTVCHCTISGNSDPNHGGGIYCNISSPTIEDCIINENSAAFGGGIRISGYSNPILINCIISGNSATVDGGGVSAVYSNPTFNNCNIIENSADEDGGGISVYNWSTLHLNKCLIAENSAGQIGGGIECCDYNSIINCTISGNSAVFYGGGLWCWNTDLHMVNTIVEGNTGDGGIYFTGVQNTSITYSDFFNNQNGNFTGDPQPGLGIITGVNANGDSCDVYYNIFLDPLFYATAGDSAFYLSHNSPCIDAGDPNSPPDPDSTVADMGAYYFDQSGAPPPSITVTYPNGGESWTVDDSVTITWTLDPGFDSLDILLTRNDGGDWETLAASLSGSDTSYTWNGVTAPASDSCRVKVSGYYGGNQAFDISDSLFSITAPPLSITVTYPNGGETWQVGDTPTITWSHDPGFDRFDLLLSRDNGGSYDILHTAPGADTSWLWSSVTGPVSNSCLVKVTGYYGNNQIDDVSDGLFSIVDSLPQPPPPGPETLWTRTYGSADQDVVYSVQETSDGGFIAVGYKDFGADKDVYLLKTDANGAQSWWQNIGGSGDDVGYSVRQLPGGGYIIAGYTTSLGSGGKDVYLIRTQASGDTVWTRTFGAIYDDEGTCVRRTSDGGYIITGYTTTLLDCTNVYLVKTDANGNRVWHSMIIGGSGFDEGYSVRQTSDGGYIIAGRTSSFGQSSDVYLVKTYAQGGLAWQRNYGGNAEDRGYDVQQLSSGGYIITGYTTPANTDDPPDVYLIKTQANGDTVWTRAYGGAGDDAGRSVHQTSDYGYFITGYTSSNVLGSYDVYALKTDYAGSVEWSRTFGGNLEDRGFSGMQTRNGGYIIAGYTLSFGAGGKDAYLIRLGRIPPVTVDLNPHNPPITVPANGGTFQFDITAENTTAVNQRFDAWTQVHLPGMAAVPIHTYRNRQFSPHQVYSGAFQQTVPGFAPGGEYIYFAIVGTYPWIVSDSDSFHFVKAAGDGPGAMGSPADWVCIGEFLEGEPLCVDIPESYELTPPYPNPFNSSVHFRFALPENCKVRLIVYDVLGREVARLIDGWLPPGYHQADLDGSRLSSGIYFARFTAGEYQRTQKLLLVK